MNESLIREVIEVVLAFALGVCFGGMDQVTRTLKMLQKLIEERGRG